MDRPKTLNLEFLAQIPHPGNGQIPQSPSTSDGEMRGREENWSAHYCWTNLNSFSLKTTSNSPQHQQVKVLGISFTSPLNKVAYLHNLQTVQPFSMKNQDIYLTNVQVTWALKQPRSQGSLLPFPTERERERERDIDRRENLGTRLALKEPGVIEFILEIKLRVNK